MYGTTPVSGLKAADFKRMKSVHVHGRFLPNCKTCFAYYYPLDKGQINLNTSFPLDSNVWLKEPPPWIRFYKNCFDKLLQILLNHGETLKPKQKIEVVRFSLTDKTRRFS